MRSRFFGVGSSEIASCNIPAGAIVMIVTLSCLPVGYAGRVQIGIHRDTNFAKCGGHDWNLLSYNCLERFQGLRRVVPGRGSLVEDFSSISGS
jgi:hypothetical protein